jgi:hypothetical protein
MYESSLMQTAVETPDLFGSELNGARNQCKQGIIVSAFNVLAWMPFGAALADYNIAGLSQLAAEQFNAKPF